MKEEPFRTQLDRNHTARKVIAPKTPLFSGTEIALALTGIIYTGTLFFSISFI